MGERGQAAPVHSEWVDNPEEADGSMEVGSVMDSIGSDHVGPSG